MATPQTTATQLQKRRKEKAKATDGLQLGFNFRLKRQQSHRYMGHRADSLIVPSDLALLVELRARHRTFQGAYARTALGNLGYALTILRLFDTRFYRIGLIFAILGGLLLLISYARDRHSRHDFADPRVEEEVLSGPSASTAPENIANGHPKSQETLISKLSGSFSRFRLRRSPIPTFAPAPPSTRIFGRPFVTAGWVVIAVTLVVLMTEIGLVVLIIKL
ncbi:hypothetical protein E1B28_013677 [Marasmius oreades]|uniref:DUF202 domain-containing protein n=1 Tax=Marasmius oreades TaxID=181124 RepID=A0A9P7RQ40_9AGAR|nr:uncharacterized protein E1B28_013677 [Marasmius oreades]KAG7087731.1 hypothetical protein E1B28_013677 [Marasmius oreades]